MSEEKTEPGAPVTAKRTEEGKVPGQRSLWGFWGSALSLIAISMSLYHLWTAAFGLPEVMIHRPVHLLFAMVIGFLLFPISRRGSASLWFYFDALLCILAILGTVHIFLDFHRITWRMPYVDPLTSGDYFSSIIIILLTLEITRRATGWPLVILAALFILYALFGSYAPGFLAHRGVSLRLLMDHLYLQPEGIYGLVTGVSATFVFLFILLGAFMEKTGIGDFFMNLATVATRNTRAGPAKAAIFSSALFGTISGSAVANVYATGTFTIPMMKKIGLKNYVAGAVEAVASTGGQIMPPVMGSGAFIMADFLGITYAKVAYSAILPAILYFFSFYMMIHFLAIRTEIPILKSDLAMPALKLLSRGAHLFLPIVSIMVLLIMDYSAFMAAFVAIILTLAVSIIRKETRMSLTGALKALEIGAKRAVPIAAALACASLIVGTIAMTGMGLKFTSMVMRVSGGSLLAALLLVMTVTIILGMGLPTAAAYIIAAIFGASTLIRLGVPDIVAHMFVFYYAIISAITPPVALAAYAGAAVADAPVNKTGFTAVKLGIVSYLVPFLFAYSPSLLLIGTPLKILGTAATAIVGVVALAAGVQGWLFRAAEPWERILLIITAILLIKPGWKTDLIGGLLLIIVLFAQRRHLPTKNLVLISRTEGIDPHRKHDGIE